MHSNKEEAGVKEKDVDIAKFQAIRLQRFYLRNSTI